MNILLNLLAAVFDRIRNFWEQENTHRFVSKSLVVIFIISIGVIEMNRQGFLPQSLSHKIPVSHYLAINLAFSLVLILEVISMIFTLPASMSKSLGKQFEILALIFLRTTFKELSGLPEPININGHLEVLWHILSYGGGAIVIFGLLGIYMKTLKHLDDVLVPGPALDRFIKAKKSVSLLILIMFTGMGFYHSVLMLNSSDSFNFYKYFYTLLIFSDILLVLVAQSYLPQFSAVFRNSGYALATLLIRMSLTSPVYYNVMIGLISILFALILTLVYNKFYTVKPAGT